jgi:hypothetical protein
VTARIILVHDDPAFLVPLIAALESAGYEVNVPDVVPTTVPPPRPIDRLEITISRAASDHPGLRIRVTGFPVGEPYAGALGQFLAEPVGVQDVIQALRLFVPD